MPDESEFARVYAADVALNPAIGAAQDVQAALAAAHAIPVAGDATHIGLYGATPVTQAAAIPDPAGGATVDSQARAAIVLILDVLGAAGGGIGITA